MFDENSTDFLKQFSGVFRFGRGLLGRSSNAYIALVALALACIWKLTSTAGILSIFAAMAIIFIFWYLRVEKFAKQHPLETLLEGGDYTAHHQMLLSAKGRLSVPAEDPTISTSGAITIVIPSDASKPPETKEVKGD